MLFLLTVLRGAPYVPSRRNDVIRAFGELYPLSKRDLLVDIGSGDGIVLREAARRGAHAIGYEINPILVLIAKFLSRRQPLVTVKQADFWRTTVPFATTVVYVFGEGRDIDKMGAWVERQATALQKSIYLISYGFELKSYTARKKVGAHFLYRIEPLQESLP